MSNHLSLTPHSNPPRFEFHELATKEQQDTAARQAALQQQDSRAATPPPDMGGGAASSADACGVLTVQMLEVDKSETPPTALDPVFADYIK